MGLTNCVETYEEYAAFVWNKEKGCYEGSGRPVCSLPLAKGRFIEQIQNGFLNMNRYDTDKVIYKKRIVEIHAKEWEEVAEP